MRIQSATAASLVLTLAVLASAATLFSSGGLLERTTRIQVDPTVVEHPEKVNDSVAPSLVRYDLRAAVHDAHIEEGPAPIRVHIVLDEFSSEGTAHKLIRMGSGRSLCTVEGTLVFEDAAGKQLAAVRIHLHGSVVAEQGSGNDVPGHQAVSDLERLLEKEIETLR